MPIWYRKDWHNDKEARTSEVTVGDVMQEVQDIPRGIDDIPKGAYSRISFGKIRHQASTLELRSEPVL
jgi:hypothetical protein